MKKEEDSTGLSSINPFASNDQIYLAAQFTSNDRYKYKYLFPLDIKKKKKMNERMNNKKNWTNSIIDILIDL